MMDNACGTYEIVHNGGVYRATVDKTCDNLAFELNVWYIDQQDRRHLEFSRTYRARASALTKLKRYFSGEVADWRPV